MCITLRRVVQIQRNTGEMPVLRVGRPESRNYALNFGVK
jgi:hypothetical protein